MGRFYVVSCLCVLVCFYGVGCLSYGAGFFVCLVAWCFSLRFRFWLVLFFVVWGFVFCSI